MVFFHYDAYENICNGRFEDESDILILVAKYFLGKCYFSKSIRKHDKSELHLCHVEVSRLDIRSLASAASESANSLSLMSMCDATHMIFILLFYTEVSDLVY